MGYNIKQNADGSTSFVNTADANETLKLLADNTVTLNGTNLSATEAGYVDGVTPGTVSASKAVIVDANKDIGDFRNLDAVNVDAGASGTAGTVDVFPATASKGKLAITCTDQTGNTTVTLNANEMGQATAINIPDPGAAAGYIALSTAALTLAEVDRLDGATAGTQVASKAVIADANINIGATKVTALHIGTSGAETQVNSTGDELNTVDVSAGSPGTVGTPASGTIALSTTRAGNLYVSTFTLTAAQIAVTDAAGSGSHGSLKLLDFPEGYIRVLGSSQVYTAFAVDGTGVPDDAVFEIGLGTTAINAAADGTLGATEDNIGGDVNITLSSGTATGKDGTATDIMHDGTSTALDLNLNWSGTADSVDGNGTIDVTGVIRVFWAFFGDAA